MPKFEVHIALESGSVVHSKVVEAEDFHEAADAVLEAFKSDSRVCDASSWNVTIKQVSDADRA
jgi:hypothetical protein